MAKKKVERPLGTGRPRKAWNARKKGWKPRLLLRIVRMRKGLSQLELAKLANTTPGHISNFERGANAPSWGMLNDLAEVLGCRTLDELVDPKSLFGQENQQPSDQHADY